MSVDHPTTPPGRPTAGSRRRGPELEQAILDAAWEELVAVGATDLTVASVAARAGTSKPVLYRRWANRAALIAATIDRRIPDLGPGPADTGSLRGDVIAVLDRLAGRYSALAALADSGADLAAYLRRRTHADGIEEMVVVLRRAGERGELPTPALPPRLARLPIDLLHTELTLGPTPVTGEVTAEIVDVIFLPLATGSPG